MFSWFSKKSATSTLDRCYVAPELTNDQGEVSSPTLVAEKSDTSDGSSFEKGKIVDVASRGVEFFKKATGTTGRHDLGDDLAHVAQNLLQHDPDFRASASSSRALRFSYRVRPDYTARRKDPAYDYENTFEWYG
ncbi:hypothetical protein AAVH_16745 [Aphelenchoides avenae]|nr:hypothetical protein AAVH_16745 [Aphelenchus avenae]